jgi:ATP-dependent helicase HrpB
LALAYPERVAQRRPGTQPRYIMANGKGVVLANDDGLANASFLVISELGNPHPSSEADPKIRRALPISLAEIREIFSTQIKWLETCRWSKRNRKVLSIRTESLGSISLATENWAQVPVQAVSVAMLDGIKQMGLNLPKAAQLLQSRATIGASDQFPDISNEGLMRNLEHWLTPYILKISSAEEWKKFNPLPALQTYIGWANLKLLDTNAPPHFITPLGNKVIIDYSGDSPSMTLRIQEMFGQTSHPLLGGHPIKITLLSPAHKPIQITNDIPGFWKGSYADVRKDMRAKYPKHPWPEDPTNADPTLRAKPRKK